MRIRTILVAAALVAGASTANAATTFDFTSPVTVGPTEAPGVWYTDRYAPAVFQSPETYGGRANTLQESTSVADGANNRSPAYSSSFYNTQGRAYDVPTGTTSMDIRLYIDPSYASSFDGQRLAGFWGVGLDGSNGVSSYPIIELDNVSGALSLRGWDSNGPGGWFNLSTTPADVTTGSWDILGITLNGPNIDYYVNGALVGTVDSGGTVSLKSTILQTYNTTSGIVDAAHWAAGPVPEPATWAMMLIGVAGLGTMARYRRSQQLSLA